MQVSSAGTTKAVTEALGGASAVLGKINSDVDVKEIQKMMADFQKESMKMEMKQDMIQDASDIGVD